MNFEQWIKQARPQMRRWRSALAGPGLLLAAASCVPAHADPMPIAEAQADAPTRTAEGGRADAPLPPDALPLGFQALIGDGALAANASLPFSHLANPPASPFVIQAATGLDQLRSNDCLAQAIYYEAASESEAGQRAVAQVVLNRVRHPSWPNSVCGVVYQGPMRPGGGCQFTFTCDGSLARRPGGPAWEQARRLAAEALAGAIYAPVGHSTHYHTRQVFPAWAPRLAKTTEIGAHIFYRLPGGWGEPRAFTDRYAGREPLPRPTTSMVRPAATAFSDIVPASFASPRALRNAPRLEVSEIETALPQPQIRTEYQNSGAWRADSPIAPPVR
jgi:hypothetical protein